MADVNYLEYGYNALRVPSSGFDLVTFISQNSYFLGFLLALVIAVGLILFLFFFGLKLLRKVF
jgi:hypothetical protein